MKHTPAHQSATSLGVSPRDDADSRVRHYLVTMGVRIVCLILMVVVVPYGWYTFVFAAGAVFLPYIAVVIANAGSESKAVTAVSPERELTTLPPTSMSPATDEHPGILRITETRPPSPRRDEDSAA